MQVAAPRKHTRRPRGPLQAAGGAVNYVEDKVTLSVVAVADKGAPCDLTGEHLDGSRVDAVSLQAGNARSAEVVVTDAGDDGTRLAELGDLVDEYPRRAARERPPQTERLQKPLARLDGHHLDEDLADSRHLDQRAGAPARGAQRCCRRRSKTHDGAHLRDPTGRNLRPGRKPGDLYHLFTRCGLEVALGALN